MIKEEELLTAYDGASRLGQKTRSGLYSFIWRWHFYAALLVIPFLLVFAVTGGVYLFKPQIEGWLYRDLYNVQPVAQNISPDLQLQAALAAFPGSRAEAYGPPANVAKSSLIRILTKEHRELTVAVNPHSGLVLGAIDDERRPLKLLRELHGKLLSGKIGQALQELAASWAMVLVVTGLYLWWPRRNSGVLGTVLPRLNVTGRVFWKDWHSVTGFWISGLLVFLIMTGLPWSVMSGELIHYAALHIGKGSPDTGLGWGGGGSQNVRSGDWAIAHAQQMAGTPVMQLVSHGTPLKLSQILQIAQRTHLKAPFEIRMPVDERGVFTLVVRGKPEATAYVHLDQYTGKVVRDIRWKDFGPLAKAIALGVALHEGRYFGLPNQLLGLLACLGLIGVAVSGLVMWWSRRPSGTLGAPVAPRNYRMNAGVIAVIALLCVLMPLMGASVLIIWMGERLVRYCLKKRAVL